MAGIYIASKTCFAPMWRKLRADGYPIISTWIDEAGPGESSDLGDLVKRCIAEASSATGLILYCEPQDILKGALIEAGSALANGKPVYVVGTCPSLATAFAHHPLWRSCASIDHALRLLGAEANWE